MAVTVYAWNGAKSVTVYAWNGPQSDTVYAWIGRRKHRLVHKPSRTPEVNYLGRGGTCVGEGISTSPRLPSLTRSGW